MKVNKNLAKTWPLFLLLTMVCLQTSYAQDSAKDNKTSKESMVKSLVEGQNYVFVAQTALPLSGRARQLTSYYDLRISKDTVQSSLPYFGRAYTAPIDPSEGGINFTSTDVEYTATEKKKGGWDVLIKPKDAKDVQQMVLLISDRGYATLQVSSTNRQAISFNGYITEKKQKRK